LNALLELEEMKAAADHFQMHEHDNDFLFIVFGAQILSKVAWS